MVSKDFVPVKAPKEKRPLSNFSGNAGVHNLVRDQLTIDSWMFLGAIAQGILILLFGRLALTPAVAVMLYRALDTYAQSTGWKRNTYMDGVIPAKVTAQFPDELGNYGNKPADHDVVVFTIGTRCNHPLGLFAPGFQEFLPYFPQMVKDLEEHAEEFGFLGMTSWQNTSDRKTGSEIMEVCYFKTTEGLHNFAHSEYHKKGWDWFFRNSKKYPHISIFHETYHVPKGHYESVYGNSHVTGILSTTTRITDAATGEDRWASPIVDSTKGILRTSAGRMSRSKGGEHEQITDESFQDPSKIA